MCKSWCRIANYFILWTVLCERWCRIANYFILWTVLCGPFLISFGSLRPFPNLISSAMLYRALAALLLSVSLARGDAPSTVRAPRGRTPVLDGIINAAEWDDSFRIDGIIGWDAQFSPVLPPAPGAPPDLDVAIFMKHDTTHLYIASRVLDDVLYALDTPAWTPAGNPGANALNRSGWPWFGDESELLFSAQPPQDAPNTSVAGNGSQWQMVFNRHKSRLGGLGVGGLLEGEPRSSNLAWATYQHWILTGAQSAATSTREHAGPGGASVYEWEWAVAFDPCLELSPGIFYNADMPSTAVGFNIALGDVDSAAQGDPTYGLRHEMWLSGRTCASTNCHTLQNEFATLILEP